MISDFTGTLSREGKLTPGLKPLLLRLAKLVDLEIVTGDTYGTAGQQLRGIAAPNLLKPKKQDVQKRSFAKRFDLEQVVAFGNGNNDRLLLRAVKQGGGVAIAIDNGEGCAIDALMNAHIFVTGAVSAFNLLLNPTALKATLRF